MTAVNLRYSPGNLPYLAFMASISAAVGGLLVQQGSNVGYLFIAASVLVCWKFLTSPRVVAVDFGTGLATFKPPRWLKKTNRPPIQIRDFSSIYAVIRKPGVTYYVAVSNCRGESVTLLSCVDSEEATKACDLISERFNLINRGLN